ncbi:hypothetical protein EVG20_g3990 [Dentipellis fragilis]|uniref:Uncharacterized protein n=1 Tax=Dentipellis fragilis TaxID=205917 RepID=A0A4Y9YXG9_9AGAM|nr:hypothetical protein EVG20_g3990 [Dentipellis fragilis]
MSAVRPTRPRNAGGLPSGPRSRSVGRDRDADSRDYLSSSSSRPPIPSTPSRQVRPQKSLANLPSQSRSQYSSESRERSRAPPTPVSPRGQRSKGSRQQQDYPPPSSRGRVQNDRLYARRSDSSSASSPNSEVSSGSSFLDRMKVRSAASSRTSWEEEEEPPRKDKGGWSKDRRPVREERPMSPEEDYVEEEPVTPGHGASLWTRMAEAASTLTVSVGKAWATNIPAYSGEETPPGQESRLTRAMKAYHLEKARDPSDLPEWLFDERERRPAGRPSTSRRRDDRDYEYERDEAPPQRSRGLRDIYDTAAAPSNAYDRSDTRPSYSRNTSSSRDDGSAGQSKANDRLKALRDAKRNAAQRNAGYSEREDSPPPRPSRGEDRRRVEEPARGQGPRRPPPTQGLPTRPGARQV